jgi:hypothetical protein
MVQCRDGPRFAFKALTKLLEGDFDCNGTVQPRVERSVDLSHTAFPERAEDFVWAKSRAGRNIGRTLS